jgi:FkbM family methyltransferase
MSSITNALYKVVISAYKISPFKKQLCMLLRSFGLANTPLYKDLKFQGKFKVKLDDKRSFDLEHHGGTIENETFWKGLFKSWENDTGWIWMQLCPHSEVIFDIGANSGIYSLVAKTLNEKASVYAFEPSVNTFKHLERNNRINGLEIICERLAVSDANGDKNFYDFTEDSQTSASLSPDMAKNKDNTDHIHYDGELLEYDVRTVTLSSFIQENNIKKIDLMKLDIEMHEPEAIIGLGEYLALYKPITVIEVLSDDVAERLNKLIGEDFIKINLISENHSELAKQFKGSSSNWNYLFFHKDQEARIKQITTLKW